MRSVPIGNNPIKQQPMLFKHYVGKWNCYHFITQFLNTDSNIQEFSDI